MKTLALILCSLASAAALPPPPHGGKVVEAEVVTKGKAATVETFFIEAVRNGDKLTLYPYVQVPKQEPGYLVVSPLVELKKVIVRLGSSLINTQRTLTAVRTKSAIETRLGVHDKRFDTVILTVDYKGGTREARFPLERAAE